MKKALVTGGAGFIGSHIVDALIERGVTLDIIDDLSTGSLKNINPKAKVRFIKIEETPPDIGEYDVIFHTAARARIQPSITDPTATDIANVHGTVRALEIARHSGAHFIMSSSSTVYGPDQVLPFREEMTHDPRTPYALTKHVGELYCDIYSQLYCLKTAKMRYFNVFGERQLLTGSYATVVGIFLDQHKQGLPLTIVGDGEQRRDFTYVKDVVAANLLLADTEATGLYNVGTGTNTSVNEVADAIGGKDYPRELGIKRLAEMRERLADASKLRALGWQPTVNVLDWLSYVI